LPLQTDLKDPIDDIVIKHGFRGSINLKRAGEVIEWTPRRQEEYIKCSLDPVYFVETYMKVVNVDRGLVPLILYDYQREMLKSMVENRNTIITTARQVGKSTITCAFILWYILFQPDKTVALLANKGDTAREIMGKVHLAYEHLPKWLQQGVLEANKGSLVLENNSRIIAAATSGSAIRGYSINLLFIDEAAFIENWEEFFTAVAPTISSGKTTKMILVSTPNGLNHYHKLWINAKEGRTDYKHIEVTWRRVPGRDEAWRKKTLADLNFDTDKFAQENECQFLGSSGTLINGKTLGSLVHQEPIVQHDGLSQYIRPIAGHQYTMIVDVSKGVGLDHQAFSVVDITEMPYQQVCVYYNNNTLPGDYAEVVYQTARLYNEATVLVEINNPAGEIVTNLLIEEFEYDGLLFTESAGRAGKRISMGMGNKAGIDKGINTTINVKAKGCSILKALVENYQLILNDHDTIEELSHFSKKGKSYEAEAGNYDDLTMTLVLFAWLTDQQFFKEMTDINTLQKLRATREEDVENSMIPFGVMVNHADAFDENGNEVVTMDDFDRQLLSDTDDRALEAAYDRVFMIFPK
jgi:hypothetical protein